MTRVFVALALLCACLASPAEARHRHHHKHHHVTRAPVLHKACNVLWPCEVPPAFAASYATAWLAPAVEAIAKPTRYVAGRLVCAVNVGLALAERGIRGTGSALAKSYLHWGHSSPPVPGAVAVSSRRGGGHVALVSRVDHGQVYVWNPSSRGRGWREEPYRHHALDFRVAG
jgi:hypothetical protein